MGGCVSIKQQKPNIYLAQRAQQTQIKIKKINKTNVESTSQISLIQKSVEQLSNTQQAKYNQTIVNHDEIKPNSIFEDILILSEKCIKAYQDHEIDQAHEILVLIQQDLKQLSYNGKLIKITIEHFRSEFVELVHKIQREYKDLIDFNNQILKDKWKVKKEKKNFKVSSKIQGDDVGILLQTILQVPFEYFIAVMIQMDLYKQLLPFIIKSDHLKDVSRNCKLGFLQMKLPIISNRQSYFQGIIYNRLKNKNIPDQQFFMFTRSIHNRLDLQKSLNYKITLNKGCVAFQYKYIAIKYVPLTQNSGKMTMGVNVDLKLNLIPVSIIQMASISFSEDFYNNIVKISKSFKGSLWQKGLNQDLELFNFLQNAKNEYLQSKLSKDKASE